MKLSVWTYEGPPHVGAMRVVSAMEDTHYVLHAPQGDTYADLLFTMIERKNKRPPVTYTTFKARDLGSDTSEIFKKACKGAFERFKPKALVVGASCTAELIQDDPGGLAEALNLPVPTIPLELPSYQRKENYGASETFYQIVRNLSENSEKTKGVSCNILGPAALGFRHRDDVVEIRKIIEEVGIEINLVAPLGASPSDIREKISRAHFNVMLYPEIAETTCRYLEKEYGQPFTKTIPIGMGATADFLREISDITKIKISAAGKERLRADWWSKSIDSTYFTGKRVFIFGDATHVATSVRIAKEEMGFEVAGLGCYNREFARDIRALGKDLSLEALITEDYLEVEAAIQTLQPELILGTQMERHIGKRLGIPCAVISAPFHVQDHPARYSPQAGWEGANVIFDTWVHPLVMGLEEHLLHMFREDFEFNDVSGPSHLAGHIPKVDTNRQGVTNDKRVRDDGSLIWEKSAELELKKIPFFVRGKAKRNTEIFARSKGVNSISKDLLYEAKAHYAN